MVSTLKKLGLGALASAMLFVLVGATTGVISWKQLNPLSVHGTDSYGQSSDGTGTSGNLAKFDANGGLTNGPSVASAGIHGVGMAWGESGAVALATGTTTVQMPFGCTLGSTWYAYSDQTVTFDVLVGGSSITASAQPSAAAGSNSGSTSTWTTTALSAGNSIGWQIKTVSGSPTTASVTIPCQ